RGRLHGHGEECAERDRQRRRADDPAPRRHAAPRRAVSRARLRMHGHEDGHVQPRLPDAAYGHARTLRRPHPPEGRRQPHDRGVGVDLRQRGPPGTSDREDRLELRTLPWAKPRYELLLIALVALVAFSPWYGNNSQDVSRLCLTNALQHGNLSNDDC